MIITQREDLVSYAKFAAYSPSYVAGQVELTSKCEQLCPNCDSWKVHRSGVVSGQLTYKEVEDLFTQLNSMPSFEHLALTGGDPLSHPDFDQIMEELVPRANFKVQINTALPSGLTPRRVAALRKAHAMRVSLDAVTKEVYYKMRGVDTDPEDVLGRCAEVDHEFWATNTCVAPANVQELPSIVQRLSAMHRPPRKASFLAVLDRAVDPGFWEAYKEASSRSSGHGIETSFEEDVVALKEFKQSKEIENIPCRVGAITFHIKCNGDVYPCCLTGGEAIITRPQFCIGSIRKELLWKIMKAYRPAKHYQGDSPCRKICQWKQVQMNVLADRASKTYMRMP